MPAEAIVPPENINNDDDDYDNENFFCEDGKNVFRGTITKFEASASGHFVGQAIPRHTFLHNCSRTA